MADDKKRLYLLETAVRVYCALAESDLAVFPSTIFAHDTVIAALKASPKPQYGVLLSEMTAEERSRVLEYVSALPPNVPEGYVFEFATKENAAKFIEQLRQWDARAEVTLLSERLVNVASYGSDIKTRVDKALAELGGRPWENPAHADFDQLDTELPNAMLQAALPVDLVEQVIAKTLQKKDGRLPLTENVVGAGPAVAFTRRIDEFVRLSAERTILGVQEFLVRAMLRAKYLPEAVAKMARKLLGEEDAGIGATGPDQTTAGAPPDKGGVAKDQPDVSKGSPARSKDGAKEEPKAPTEHVPTTEEGAPGGDVTLPDGTVVPQDVLRQALSKMLTVLATQVANNTTSGAPAGPAQGGEETPPPPKPGDSPAGEAPAAEADAAAEEDTPPAADGSEPAPGENPADKPEVDANGKPKAGAAPPPPKKKPGADDEEGKKKPPFAKESVDDDADEPSPALLKALETFDEKAELKELSLKLAQGEIGGLSEIAPPGRGWERLVRGLKKHRQIDNPFALAWWMKKKGYQPETSRASEAAPAPAAAPADAPPPPAITARAQESVQAPASAPARQRTRIEAVEIAYANGKTKHEIAQAILDDTIFEMTATMPDIIPAKDALTLGKAPSYGAATIPYGAISGTKAISGQQLNTTPARQSAPARDAQQPANYAAGAGKAASSSGVMPAPPVQPPKAAKIPESKGYGRVCPTCKGKVVESCRCARSDSVCENGHRWHICTEHRVSVVGESDHGKPGCSCKGAQVLREDEKDEKQMALVAWEQAKTQVQAFKSASFNLVTRDLVQASHVAEALGAKKGARAVGKLIAVMKDILAEATTILADFDEAHATFQREIGGGAGEKPTPTSAAAGAEEPQPTEKPEETAPAEPAAEKPAAAAEKPPAEKKAPPAAEKKPPIPPKKEEARVVPAVTPAPEAFPETYYTDPKDRAVARLTKERKIPERILAGEPYATIAESVRVRCSDLMLTAYDVAEVIQRIKHVEETAAARAIGVTLDEADRKLLGQVVTPRDHTTRSLIARTAGGREAVVTESDLEEAVQLLRRFGDARHKLLADDLAGKLKAEVTAAR